MTRTWPSVLALLAIAGCSGELPDNNGIGNGPGPDVHQAPPPKDPGQTGAGCNGVTDKGECDAGTAKWCELGADGGGKLRQTDCKALHKECVVETETGAQCREAPGCDNGLSAEGVCLGNAAFWCNTTEAQSMGYDCDRVGMTCQLGAAGAWCFNPQPEECARIGYRGECAGADGNTVRYCPYKKDGSEDIQLAELACDPDHICQVDACGEGAWCCPRPPPPPGDTFDGGSLDDWTPFGTGYTLTNDAGTALISGDADPNPLEINAGMQKLVSADLASFKISFKWRAYSESLGGATTNATLELADVATGEVLYSEMITSSPGGDTGWMMYSKDLTSALNGHTNLLVKLFLTDAWPTDYQQKNWYDDIVIGK